MTTLSIFRKKTILIPLILSVMAISCKKDQAIPFNTLPGCGCDDDAVEVYVQDGDTPTIQLPVTTLFTDENLISNGDFASGSGWTTGAYWTIGSGVASAVGLGAPGSNLYRDTDVDVIDGGYYRITFDLVPDGMLMNMSVSLGGVPAGSLQGYFLTSQTITLFMVANGASNNEIVFSVEVGTFTIDNVKVEKMSELLWQIRDCDTQEVLYEDSTVVQYFETGAMIITPEYPVTEPTANFYGYAQLSIDWASLGLPEGCYCFCIKDYGYHGFNYIRNSHFDTTDFWTISNGGLNGWAITGGQAVHTAELVGGNDTLSQTLLTPTDPDLCYILSWDVIDAGSWSFTIKADTAEFGVGYEIGIYSGSGNTTQTAEITGLTITKLIFQVGQTNDSTIDNVSLVVDYANESPCVPCECVFSKFAYKHSHDDTFPGLCNMLLKGTNTGNAFGIDYDTLSYEMTMRVFGRIRNGQYSFPDEEIYWKSNGEGQFVNARRIKSQELQIHQRHEPIFDVISLIAIHQNFTITVDGVETTYVKKPGDMTPLWRKSSEQAFLVFDIQEKTQDTYNSIIDS